MAEGSKFRFTEAGKKGVAAGARAPQLWLRWWNAWPKLGVATPQNWGARTPAAPSPFCPLFPASVKRDLLHSVMTGDYLDALI